MKFGVQIENHHGFTYDEILKVAREAERLGFHGLFICDHLQGRTEELARRSCLDTWVTLGALAAETKKLELGTLVSPVGFRNPSILAKMAATLDHISDGRLNLSVGAGWYEPEYNAYGIPFPPVGQRMRQLREAIQIIRTMWTTEKANFNGKFYNVKEGFCYPKPAKARVWVGGIGEKTLLRVVADLADGWNASFTTAEEYEQKLRALESYCEDAGRNVENIERSYYASALTAKTEKEFLDDFQKHYSRYKRPDESPEAFVQRVRGTTRTFTGTVDEVTEKVAKFSKLGVTYVIFYFPDKDPAGMMSRFAEHILPSFEE